MVVEHLEETETLIETSSSTLRLLEASLLCVPPNGAGDQRLRDDVSTIGCRRKRSDDE